MPLGRNSTAPRTEIGARADKVIDSSAVEGNLVKCLKPTFISMVGLPANQAGFKVVREDKGKTMHKTLVRRTRRSEVGPVMRLTFPEGYDELSVAEALKNYGLTGYKVEQVEGVYTATRADLKSISESETMQIRLSEDGLTAVVARQDTTVGEKGALTLSQVEFDSEKFTLENVQRWMSENGVEGTVEEPQNAGDNYVVRRSAIPENEETRQMVLEDGVIAVVTRSDAMNVPAGMVAVVNETAYGNWGWGQLDFAAAMGDKEFSEAMRNSIYTLEDVLRNIVIYSALPLDVRKELANRALAQFGEYIGNVMDSLPRQLLVSVVRSANLSQEKQMTQKQPSGSTTPAATTPETKEVQTLTRADVQEVVKSMLPEMVTALRAAITEGAAPAKTEGTPPANEASTETISRADLAAAFAEGMKPLADAIQALQGQTVVRSAHNSDDGNKEEGEGKTKDVFRGAFPGLRVAKR